METMWGGEKRSYFSDKHRFHSTVNTVTFAGTLFQAETPEKLVCLDVLSMSFGMSLKLDLLYKTAIKLKESQLHTFKFSRIKIMHFQIFKGENYAPWSFQDSKLCLCKFWWVKIMHF